MNSLKNAGLAGVLAIALHEASFPAAAQQFPEAPRLFPELNQKPRGGSVFGEPPVWTPNPSIGPITIYDIPAILPDGSLNKPDVATLQDYARYFRSKGYSGLRGRESTTNFVAWAERQNGEFRAYTATVVRCEGRTNITAHLDVELPCGATLLAVRLPDAALSDRFWGTLVPAHRIEIGMAFNSSPTNGARYLVDAHGTNGHPPKIIKQ